MMRRGYLGTLASGRGTSSSTRLAPPRRLFAHEPAFEPAPDGARPRVGSAPPERRPPVVAELSHPVSNAPAPGDLPGSFERPPAQATATSPPQEATAIGAVELEPSMSASAAGQARAASLAPPPGAPVSAETPARLRERARAAADPGLAEPPRASPPVSALAQQSLEAPSTQRPPGVAPTPAAPTPAARTSGSPTPASQAPETRTPAVRMAEPRTPELGLARSSDVAIQEATHAGPPSARIREATVPRHPSPQTAPMSHPPLTPQSPQPPTEAMVQKPTAKPVTQAAPAIVDDGPVGRAPDPTRATPAADRTLVPAVAEPPAVRQAHTGLALPHRAVDPHQSPRRAPGHTSTRAAQVHIGTIEVRVVSPPAAPTRPTPAPAVRVPAAASHPGTGDRSWFGLAQR